MEGLNLLMFGVVMACKMATLRSLEYYLFGFSDSMYAIIAFCLHLYNRIRFIPYM